MKYLKNIWKWLDGNKTIICGVIVSFASQGFARDWLGVPSCSVLVWVFGPAGALSLIHHAAKGKFSTKSN